MKKRNSHRYLYHCTNVRYLESIMKDGIIPAKHIRAPDADPDRVWFFPTLELAKEGSSMLSCDSNAFLKVDTQLLPDGDRIVCEDFGVGTWCSYEGKVPSDAILEISILEGGHSWKNVNQKR